MYSILMSFVLEYLKNNFNATDAQFDYYGNFTNVDLRESAVLLEPKIFSAAPHSTVWGRGDFHIRIWILVDLSIDYIETMTQTELVLDAEDADQEVYGLHATLSKMRVDSQFLNLNGKSGGKRWRIGPTGLSTKGPTFGIQVLTSGSKVNVAQVDLFLNVEKEL